MRTTWTDVCKESEPIMEMYEWKSQQNTNPNKPKNTAKEESICCVTAHSSDTLSN